MEDEIYIDGSYYKIGAHGKVFMLINGEWRLSSKSPRSLKRAIKYRDRCKSLRKRLKD